MMTSAFNVACLLVAVLSVSACKNEDKPDTQAETPDAAVSSTPVGALVQVGDSWVTETQIDVLKARLPKGVAADNSSLLDSLISGRAMGIKAQETLTAEEQVVIEAKVALFRDELYTRAFLKTQVKPELITEQQVEEYYLDNLDLFGAELIKQVAILTFKKPEDATRDKLLRALSSDTPPTLKALHKQYSKTGGAAYRETTVQKGLLSPSLEQLALSVSQESPLKHTLSQGNVVAVQWLSQEQQQPEPLDNVREKIRQLLAAGNMRKAIKKASDTALETVPVNYYSTAVQQ